MPTLGRGSRSTVSKEHKCTVQLLDDTQTMTVDFKKNDLGQVVLDYICDILNVVEKDYFGLRYVDTNRHRYWLDTNKPVLRQVKSASIVFAFRVKFYPSDPTIVKEELTRYLLALQLKRDLLHGRLYCPQSDAAVLGAYILQGEIGDYDASENAGNYVSQFKLFLNQTPKLEEKIALEHQKLKGKGLAPADADLQFLKKACALDTYGYYPYTIKDPKAGQVYMGATPHGVLVYQTHRKLHHIKWDDIKDFDYVGKDFYIYPKAEYFDENNIEEDRSHAENDTSSGKKNGDATITSAVQNRSIDQNTDHSKNGNKKRPALRFNCPSAPFSKHLWKYMLAQQAFFTKQRSTEVKPVAIRRGPLFRRATFRYTGRVLQEIKEAPSPKRAEPSFERFHLQRQMPRDERNAPWANKFHTLPRATKPAPDVTDYLPAPAVSKEAPERVEARDSLVVETTAQTTPIITPLSGLSPNSFNGPSAHDTSITASSANDSFTAATTRISETTTSLVGGGYKQDTVVVSLKHVEQQIEKDEQDIQKLVKDFEREAQRPLGTSTPVSSDTEKQKSTTTAKEKPRNGASITPTVSVSAKPPTAPTKIVESTSTISESAKISAPVSAAVGAQPTSSRARAGSNVARALVKTLLSGLMFTILLIGAVVVIMEIQDPNFRSYLGRVPGEDSFRHQYYEPSRQRALDWYEGMTAGRGLDSEE